MSMQIGDKIRADTSAGTRRTSLTIGAAGLTMAGLAAVPSLLHRGNMATQMGAMAGVSVAIAGAVVALTNRPSDAHVTAVSTSFPAAQKAARELGRDAAIIDGPNGKFGVLDLENRLPNTTNPKIVEIDDYAVRSVFDRQQQWTPKPGNSEYQVESRRTVEFDLSPVSGRWKSTESAWRQ